MNEQTTPLPDCHGEALEPQPQKPERAIVPIPCTITMYNKKVDDAHKLARRCELSKNATQIKAFTVRLEAMELQLAGMKKYIQKHWPTAFDNNGK